MNGQLFRLQFEYWTKYSRDPKSGHIRFPNEIRCQKFRILDTIQKPDKVSSFLMVKN